MPPVCSPLTGSIPTEMPLLWPQAQPAIGGHGLLPDLGLSGESSWHVGFCITSIHFGACERSAAAGARYAPRYNNDPCEIALACFSGTGNVATSRRP